MKKYLLLGFLLLSLVYAQTNSESDDFSYPLKLYNQSLYELAAKQFAKFYNSYPNSTKASEAKYYAGMSYFKLGNYNLARIEFQSAAIEYPGSSQAGECWFKTGECYDKMDNKTEAAKAFETIRLLYPEDPLAPKGLYLAGNLYSDIDQEDKARQMYRIIIDRYSTAEEYYLAIVKTAQSHYKMGELQEANDLLEKVLSSKTSNESLAEAYLLKAKINKTQGYFSGAISYYQLVIDQYPDANIYSLAAIDMVELLIQQGQLEKAKNIISESISKEKVKSNQNLMHRKLGDIYFLDNKYALALKEYETSGSGKDIELKLQLKKALSKYKQNLHSEAIEELNSLLKSNLIDDENTYNFIFEVYINWLVKDHETQQAINVLFTRISETHSQENKIRFATALAELLRQKKQWREITQILQPFLFVSGQYPEMDDVFYYLGMAYENLDNYDQSVYYYKRLLNDFNASVHHRNASERLEYLNTYKVVDIDQTVLEMANILGKSLGSNSSTNKLLFEHAQLFYDKLKNYEGAEKQLLLLLEKNPENLGDVYLLLGKTYLKLSDMDENKGEISINLRKKAYENFKLSVANIATCSQPDEASWLRIISGLNGDSISVIKEKTLIEALINKYPDSDLLEDWYKSLAYSLSFEESYFESGIAYLKKLITDFKQSASYPSYLYSYAQLIDENNKEGAQKIYKQIASEYSNSEVAALALAKVAEEYQALGMFEEAYTLYKQLINNYYYSEIAHENKIKLALTAIKAGHYDEVIKLGQEFLYPVISSDIIICKEFFGKDISEYIYLSAKAYEGKQELKTALDYLQQYLNIAQEGKYIDDARFDIGQIFYNKNQKNIALDNFRLVTNENPALYKQSRLYIAEIYFDQNNYKQAAEMYKKVRPLIDETNKSVLIKVDAQLIISLIREGNLKESNTLIKQFGKTYSDQKNYLAQFEIEQGDYYRMKKDYTSAKKKYEQVKNNYKSSDYVDDADYNIALIHLTLNENEKAFAILSNFYKNYTKSDKLPAALNSLGTLYYRSEKYDVAISMFKNALTSCKDIELERSILSNLIQTYTLTSFWDAAQATARQYVEKFPNAQDNLDKKIVIAQAYINLNQFDNAVEYLRKIKYEADSEREPEIQYYIGEAYLKAGQYENAIAEFVKIPLLSKKTKLQWEASALYYSGQSYEKLGRIDDAVRMYQEIVNRPGIDLVLKREAEKRIQQIQ
jgi:tetratricopeptide (TPR) repeat protein